MGIFDTVLHAGEVGRGWCLGRLRVMGRCVFSVLWRSFCFAFSFFGSCVSVCMPVI